MDLLKVTFTILLLLFPLGQIDRFEFQNGAAITLNDIFVGVVVVIWLMVGGLRKQSLKTSLTKPIVVFSIIGFLTLIINMRFLDISQFFISSLYGVRWLLYAAIFFVVSGFDLKFKRRTLIMMIFVGTVVVLGGYIQYFFYLNLRNLYYLGWDEHLYRIFSSFLDPNFAGAFFVLYFLLLSGLLLDSFEKKQRLKKGNLGIIALFLSGLVTLIAIILTYSRSAYIMLLVGAITFLILKKQKKIAVGFILVFFMLIVYFSNLRIEGMNPLRIASSEARLESASHAITIIRNNPILGVGFNAYRYAQVRYGFIQEDSDMLSHSGAGTDNSFLFVLATTGIIGFTAYIYMWLKILSYTFKVPAQNNFQKTIACVVIASTVGIFVNALFINSLFYPSIMLWMWVLIGLRESR